MTALAKIAPQVTLSRRCPKLWAEKANKETIIASPTTPERTHTSSKTPNAAT